MFFIRVLGVDGLMTKSRTSWTKNRIPVGYAPGDSHLDYTDRLRPENGDVKAESQSLWTSTLVHRGCQESRQCPR